MHLSSLSLTQFKNYVRQDLSFSPRLNAFVGPNGAGKTNLLEGIYYLCMGKSYTSSPDQYAVRHGDDVSRMAGVFVVEEAAKEKVVVKLQKRKRKIIERNGVAYERLADHVGRYPVVIVVPDDTRYLLQYNKLLANRNALLKELDGRRDTTGLLDIYDLQMADPAAYLHEKRTAFVAPFTDMLTEAYAAISGNRETVGVSYKSQLHEQSWAELLTERREKDRILQRTSAGIHKDDLVFTQQGHPLRRVASQGQLKSFVLSLKLAQYRLLERSTRRRPILLLDDIFDKLDQQRVRQLLELVLSSDFGQVFLSDTDPDRIAGLLTSDTEWKQFSVDQGEASE